MKKLTATFVFCSLLLVTACGRVQNKNYEMSEGDAMDLLASTPRGYTPKTVVTLANLEDLVGELVESGQAQIPEEARGAVGSGGLSQLNTLLNLLSQTKDLTKVAQGMVNANQGNQAKAKFSLDKVLTIMQVVMPLIVAVAPQFAPIAQAVLTIVPMIKSIIESFQKPATSASFAPASVGKVHTSVALVRGLQPYRA